MVHRRILQITMLLLLIGSASPVRAGSPVNADKPFKTLASMEGSPAAPGGSVELLFTVHVLADHYLYRSATSVEITDAGGLDAGSPRYPAAKTKYDKWEAAEVEIYEKTFTIPLTVTVPADASPGEYVVLADVRYRGCNPTMCFFPTTDNAEFRVVVEGDAAADAAESGPGSDLEGEGRPEGDEEPRPSDPLGGPDGGDGVAPDASGAGTEPGVGDPAPPRPGDVAGGHETGAETGTGVAGEEPTPTPLPEVSGEAEPAPAAVASGAGGAAELSQKLSGFLEAAAAKNFALVLLLAFLGGILASLTPCVLPMVPITVAVIGARGADTKLKAFSLSMVYVLGIATLYSGLGGGAAATGTMLGEVFNNPWVLLGLVTLFVVLALGMFGVYNFALPSSLNTKLSQVGGQGYVGVFVIGLAAGVVASPCTGPVVGSAVLLIAGGQFSLLQGFAVMFSFSMGLGLLFLVIGTFSALMLQPGAWMTHVKNSFGFIMLLAAVYFGSMTGYLPEVAVGALSALLLVMWGVSLGVFTPMESGAGWGAIALRTFALLLVMTGFLNLGWSCYGDELTSHPPASATGAAVDGIRWEADHEAAFASAAADGLPLMLDFTAENCAQCRELEHKTFPDPEVIRLSRSFVAVTVDCTRLDEAEKALVDRYGVPGMPRIVFTRPDGTEIDGTAIQGFVPPPTFTASMNSALAAL